ncbi:MAG: hypothetical protein WCR42_08940 [bacterium]
MTKVIYKLENGITAEQICPFDLMSQPSSRIFNSYNDLNYMLRYSIAPGQSVAIVCGTDFGCGPRNYDAVNALMSYNLTIIAKSISPDFLAYCGEPLNSKFIQNSDLIAGFELGIDDIALGDELQIQTFKVIKKTSLTNPHHKPKESKDDKKNQPNESN